jgi:hypothetical protein
MYIKSRLHTTHYTSHFDILHISALRKPFMQCSNLVTLLAQCTETLYLPLVSSWELGISWLVVMQRVTDGGMDGDLWELGVWLAVLMALGKMMELAGVCQRMILSGQGTIARIFGPWLWISLLGKSNGTLCVVSLTFVRQTTTNELI